MAEAWPRRPPAGEVAAPAAGRGAALAAWVAETGPPGPPGLRRDPVAVWRDTLRDEQAWACLTQRLDAVVAAPWSVAPGGPARVDRLAADALADQLGALPFDRICRELLHAVWYGFAVAEALWEMESGRVRLADLRTRAPERFRWSASGAPLLATAAAPGGVALPAAKFVTLRMPAEHGGLAHGPGAARWCAWPVWLKRNGLRFWSIALDKFGAPTPQATYPPGAGEEEIRRLLGAMERIATGAGVALPEGQRIELLDTARRAGGDYAAFIAYLDRAIAKAVLTQTATVETGPWRGTAEVQERAGRSVIRADARRLDAALNATVGRWLTAWNFPGAAPPRIARDAGPAEDLDARAAREETIARLSGLRPTRAHVERVYGGDWGGRVGSG